MELFHRARNSEKDKQVVAYISNHCCTQKYVKLCFETVYRRNYANAQSARAGLLHVGTSEEGETKAT